jgi:hypothetical protein
VTEPTPISDGTGPTARRPRARRPGADQHRDDPWSDEYDRDVWRLPGLGIVDRNRAHLRFDVIPQPWLKGLAKRWARWRLSCGRGVATVVLGTMAVARFGTFLAAETVAVDGLDQVDRAVLERYLAHLHTELGGRTVHRVAVGQLNLFLTAIRQHRWDDTLSATAMFFPEDFPKESADKLPRALTEHVMAQLEHPDNLTRWNDPTFD